LLRVTPDRGQGNLAAICRHCDPGAAPRRCPDPQPRWLEGPSDTLAILIDAIGKQSHTVAPFEKVLASTAAAGPVTLADAWIQIELLAASAADAAGQFTTKDPTDLEIEASIWARALERQCVELRDDLIFLAPWLELPMAAGTRPDLPGSTIPTLRELALLDATWAPIIKRARDSAATPEAQESLDALQRLARRVPSGPTPEWSPSKCLRSRRPPLPQWTMTSCTTRCVDSW
jgi:hypothetical protein